MSVECVRCGEKKNPPASVTYGGKLGEEIRAKVCADCWSEWEAAEVKVINELRLNFMDPKSQDVLVEHLREFLRLDGGDGSRTEELTRDKGD